MNARRHALTADDVDLAGSTFHDVNLAGARFDDVDLQRAAFDDVNLAHASFKNVDLSRARFRDVDLSRVSIEADCDVTGLTIGGVAIAPLLEAHRTEPKKRRKS